jgi:hypothetical protein
MKPTEIAELIGVKYASLAQTIRRQGVKKYEGGYSLSEVQAAKFRAGQKDNRSPLSEGDPRRVKVELENQLLQIKIDELEKRLVDAEQVEQEAQRVGSAIRNDILSLPQSLAPRLAGKTDLAEISKTLDDALRDCLRHLADTVCNTPAE